MRPPPSLRRISYTNVSKASSQVRSQAINVAAQLDRAHSRTSGAGEALTTYADRLREAQKDSEIALRRAQNAVANRRAAEAMREERAKAHNNCLDLRLREQYRDDYERYGRRADQAEAERRQAAQDVVRARDARKAAARSAAQKLGEVQRTSPLNDNFLDRIRSIMQKVQNWVSEGIKRIIGAVASIAKAIWDKVNAAWRALVKGVMVVITGLGAIYDRIIRKTLPLINRIRGFYNSNIDKLRRRMILKADESNAPNENEPKGAPSSMSDLIDHRSGMDKDDGLRLEEIRCKDGKTRYVLYIDGTESGKGAYYDSHTWPENVPAYAGWRTDTDVRISELLRTHVKPPGSEIMVCGYSQGGLHALALADTGEFKVTQVVNTYSPDMSVPVNLHGAQVINLRDTKEPVGFIRGQSGNQTQNFYGTSDGMSFELDRHVDDGAQKQIVKQFENSTDPRLDSQKREISKYLGGELVRVID